MRLPNMTRTIRRFSQPLTFITEVITTKDFKPDFAVTRKSIEGVISSLPDEVINKDSLDWSLEYYTVHVQPNMRICSVFTWSTKEKYLNQLTAKTIATMAMYAMSLRK